MRGKKLRLQAEVKHHDIILGHIDEWFQSVAFIVIDLSLFRENQVILSSGPHKTPV